MITTVATIQVSTMAPRRRNDRSARRARNEVTRAVTTEWPNGPSVSALYAGAACSAPAATTSIGLAGARILTGTPRSPAAAAKRSAASGDRLVDAVDLVALGVDRDRQARAEDLGGDRRLAGVERGGQRARRLRCGKPTTAPLTGTSTTSNGPWRRAMRHQ